jgi:hypothetical protein
LYNNGTPISYLAHKYKVSRPTIYSVLKKVQSDNKKNEFYFDKSSENKDMSEQNNMVKTTFLGVTIDLENGSSNPKIRKALDKSFQLLDIMKFIEVAKFKLNMTMFDYFWQVVVGNTRTMIGTRVLEWFGYEGEYRKQRQNFKLLLKNNNIKYDEMTQKDQDIKKIVGITSINSI